MLWQRMFLGQACLFCAMSKHQAQMLDKIQNNSHDNLNGVLLKTALYDLISWQ